MKSGLTKAILLILLGVFFVVVCGKDRISKDAEARLEPVIVYMDAFLKKHHRLPTKEEFESGTAKLHGMLILRDRSSPYAASKGAKAETDYMIGTWRADWYHYYKSWDRSFLNGYDERF